jgi:hypothetical protein
MAIPRAITLRHVINAMNELGADTSRWPKNRFSKHFDVVHPETGWRLPPKLVLSYAAKFAIGRQLLPDEFGGGAEANGYLEDLGFRVIDRRKV